MNQEAEYANTEHEGGENEKKKEEEKLHVKFPNAHCNDTYFSFCGPKVSYFVLFLQKKRTYKLIIKMYIEMDSMYSRALK